MMYWRQPAAQRTMKSYLALSEAVRAELNPTDSRVHRWSAEVSARRKNVNAEEGMFVSLTAAGVADEVFTCTLVDHPETSKELSSAPTAANERQVVVLRKEREVMEGTTRVKEYLARCKSCAQEQGGRRRVVVRRLRREDRAGGERAGDVRGAGVRGRVRTGS